MAHCEKISIILLRTFSSMTPPPGMEFFIENMLDAAG